MSWGFYQLHVEPKSQSYTAFSTLFGSFKWLRMPMGLTGSPNAFERLMEDVLVGLTWNITVPYLDDCIIFSKTPEEHIKRLQQVFQRVREANPKINPTKCAFFQTEVQFLGHVISKNGLEVDPEEVKAVQNFPVPQNQTDVKSFLGICSYYRLYIKNFAMIARPLHKASETKSSFTWTEELQEAFESLKKHLSSTPILAFPDVKQPFILYTDANLTAMGAVLAQVQDGKEQATCYASKAFSKSQTNYSATKREFLEILTFTRHFKHYLLGRKIKNVTDHRALQWLHNFKDPVGLTARCLEKLAAFDCEVQHRPGKSIGHADGLSRMPIVNQVTSSQSKEKPDEPVKTKFVELSLKNGNLFESKDSLAHCISSDFKMSAGIARSFKHKFPYKFPESTNSPLFVQQVDDRFIYHLVTKKRFFQKPTYDSLRQSLEAMTKHANKHKVTEISMPKAGCGLDRLEWYKVERLIREICAQSNLTITVYDQSQKQAETPMRSALGQAQRQDEALYRLIECIEKRKMPTSQELQGLPRLAGQLNNQLKSLQLFDGILCRKFETVDNQVVLQQIVPPSMTQGILSTCHLSPTAGHLGVAKTSEKIKQRFYWPGLQEDTKLSVSRCPEYQKRWGPPKKYHHALVEWQASYPFHHIGIGFMRPLPMSNGNKHILVIGDHFTKWYEAIPLPDQTAVTTANALVDQWISRFGCPHSLHSDQGRNFESKLFEQLMQLLEIDKTRTTPFHSQSNAVIERMNKTLQNMLAKCVNEEQSNWHNICLT